MEKNSPWPFFTEADCQAVFDLLKSNRVNYWTGDVGLQFEKEFASYIGSKFAIAVANGTLALDLALYGLGVGSHNGGSRYDEVIVTSRSFVASAACIVRAGAIPVFCDIERDSLNLDPEYLCRLKTSNTKAVICVHHAGWPCDIDRIRDVLGNHIFIVEDCAQAHGAMYKGKRVGNLGDVAAWSFCQDKIMSTGGEGGMVTVNSEVLWRRMWSLKDHGKQPETRLKTNRGAEFVFVHDTIGSNFRMLEMQALIGLRQLETLNKWVAKRNYNARFLEENIIKNLKVKDAILFPRIECDGHRGSNDRQCCLHAYYRLYSLVNNKYRKLVSGRSEILDLLSKKGVPCSSGSCPEIYMEKAFMAEGRPNVKLPNASLSGETSIAFLVHPTLDEEQLYNVASDVSAVVNQYF